MWVSSAWLLINRPRSGSDEPGCQPLWTVVEAVTAAKRHGTVVSYDLNYRPSLWKAIGGQAKAQEVNREIARHIDVMSGNEEDFTASLGFEVEGTGENLSDLAVDKFAAMIAKAAAEYTNFKLIATPMRTVRTASRP